MHAFALSGFRVRRGFTLVEVMVAVGIFTVLLALLFAGVQTVRSSAVTATCANNLRQIGLAMQQYRVDEMPIFVAGDLRSKIAPFLKDQTNASNVFACPVTQTSISYGANFCLERFQPSDNKIVVVEASQPDIQWMGGNATYSQFQYAIQPRHRGFLNALYYDGRVQRFDVATINPYDSANGAENVTNFWEPINKNCASCFVGGNFIGTYYGTANFTGPSAQRQETTLHLPYGANPAMYAGVPYNAPNPPIPNCEGNMSAVYTGRIRADKTDTYTFYLACDNDAWVYFKGNLIKYRQAGNWGFCSTCVQYVETIYTIQLNAYEWFDFEVRTANYGGPAFVSVLWSNSSNPQPSVIPSSCLSVPSNFQP